MEEKTVTMMEGVAREWRVRVKDSAGNVLNPEGFSFYGAAADGVQVPRRMQVHVEGDVAVLRLPGLWMSGRCWRYQVMCQDVLTGVEWVLCQGDVVLERRVACNGPALHEDAVLVDAVLYSELDQVDVVLGDSTAATAEAARLAEAAREGAEAGAARSVDAAAKAEALKGVALDAAAKAALSAEGAEDSKHGAEAAAGDAAADAQVAEGKAAEAEVSREAAEAAQRQAEAKAAEAEAGAKVATEAVSDALAARDEAVAAQVVAEDASVQAGRYAAQAVGAADGAVVAQGAAEAARAEAEAAQSGAAEQAAIATAAAEAAQAPESIAAQAARPATMVLLKDELLALLGDASLFDLDTDGQKIIVHTDRLDDEGLAKVEDMLGRFVPQFIEVARYNHTMEISWREINKYAECVTPMDMYAVSPETTEFKSPGAGGYTVYITTDYLADGSWPWPLPKLETTNCGRGRNVFELYALPELNISLPSLKIWSMMPSVDRTWKTKRVIVDAPQVQEVNYCWGTVIQYFYITSENVTKFTEHTWSTKLTQVDFELPKLNDGYLAFNRAALNKESTLRILNSIPSYTSGNHPLTIGIHVDHQTDDEVLAAIANAESKGWAMTVQWNGTPTAQASVTYGLRKPPIYAKVSERERPDGTTERFFDWGHYVTDPSGYEEFRSEEAAREYYGLPEEDLTETE